MITEDGIGPLCEECYRGDMMRALYTILTHPKISKIYLVWDDDNERDDSLGSKCIFVFIEGVLYRWTLGFMYWQDLLNNVSYTHSSGLYTLKLIPNTNSISYWQHHTMFDSVESLIKDVEARVLLEML